MNKWCFLLVMLLALASCGNNDEVVLIGDWEKVGDFDGVARASASSFTINGVPYIGLGYNSSTAGKKGLKDFYRYNLSDNSWTKIKDLPEAFKARYDATALSIGNKGYIGLGRDGSGSFNDFWEYDPASDTWTQLTDFPAEARYSAVGAGINGKGYVGTGINSESSVVLKDFYRFTPDGDKGKWDSIPSYNGSKRSGASVFVIDNKMYLFGGANNLQATTDFHRYDPSVGEKGAWTKLREIKNATTETFDDDYGALARRYASTFVINNLAYVALGDNNGQVNTSTYEYNSTSDIWIKRTAFEGYTRTNAVGFYFQNRGFVATGGTSSNFFDDVWEFHPGIDRNDSNN